MATPPLPHLHPHDRVLLLHGLGENSTVMAPLAERLKRNDFEPISIDYPSTRLDAEGLLDYLRDQIESYRQGGSRVHCVGHSLGAVLMHCLLSEEESFPNLGRCVWLAPAFRGSMMFNLYRWLPAYRATLGPILEESGTDERCFTRRFGYTAHYDVGILAGILPGDPVASCVIPWPHDGRTSVAGTQLQGMRDHLSLPTGHEAITMHPIAMEQTAYFLKHGEFRRSLPLAMAAAA